MLVVLVVPLATLSRLQGVGGRVESPGTWNVDGKNISRVNFKVAIFKDVPDWHTNNVSDVSKQMQSTSHLGRFQIK